MSFWRAELLKVVAGLKDRLALAGGTMTGPLAVRVTNPGGTQVALDVDLEGGSGVARFARYGVSGPVIQGRQAAGTRALPTASPSAATLLGFRGFGYTGSAFVSGATGVAFLLEAAELWSTTAYGTQIRFFTTPNTTTAMVERLKIGNDGQITITGSLSRGVPVTKTADFTVAITESNLINNKAAATCTVTLPAAASFPGREILIKNIVAFTVVSASSNVVPLAGGAAATAILAATPGKWAKLVSDGTNWIIMAAA